MGKMGRALAIDYGRKRCGVAVTDPARIIASPLLTVPSGELEAFLREYIPQENVTDVIIGYPVTMNICQAKALNTLIRSLPGSGKSFRKYPCTWLMNDSPHRWHCRQ